MDRNMIPGEARNAFFDVAGELLKKKSYSPSEMELLKNCMSGICKTFMVEEHMQEGGMSMRGNSWDGGGNSQRGSYGNGMGMMRGNYYDGDGGNSQRMSRNGGGSYRMSRDNGLQQYLDRMMREAVSERERDIIQQIKELASDQG